MPDEQNYRTHFMSIEEAYGKLRGWVEADVVLYAFAIWSHTSRLNAGQDSHISDYWDPHRSSPSTPASPSHDPALYLSLPPIKPRARRRKRFTSDAEGQTDEPYYFSEYSTPAVADSVLV